jgi:hypothetical protein
VDALDKLRYSRLNSLQAVSRQLHWQAATRQERQSQTLVALHMVSAAGCACFSDSIPPLMAYVSSVVLHMQS